MCGDGFECGAQLSRLIILSKKYWCNPLFCSWSTNNPPPNFEFFVFFLILAPAGGSNPAGGGGGYMVSMSSVQEPANFSGLLVCHSFNEIYVYD